MKVARTPWWVYFGLALVFVGAVAIIAVTPAARQTVQDIASGIGITALLGALFTLVRDSTAHERAMWLKRDEQQFNLGVTSHMANVVFDKHVTFCELYIAQVQETVTALAQTGPTRAALNLAHELMLLRRKYAAWITKGITTKLESFEAEIRKMGADADYLDALNRAGPRPELAIPGQAERDQQRRDAVHLRFRELLPDLFGDNDELKDTSAIKTIELVRDVLEVERLVELRGELVRRAHQGLREGAGANH